MDIVSTKDTKTIATKKTNTIATNFISTASINCITTDITIDHSTIDNYYYLLSLHKTKRYNIK